MVFKGQKIWRYSNFHDKIKKLIIGTMFGPFAEMFPNFKREDSYEYKGRIYRHRIYGNAHG